MPGKDDGVDGSSSACVAFHGAADAVIVNRELVIVDGEPTLERLEERLSSSALCVNAIDLNRCHEITDDFIVALAEECDQLETVNFEWCSELTDASIKALAENCPQLKSVNVRKCYKITDTSIEALAEKCDQLETVNFVWCVGADRRLHQGARGELPSAEERERPEVLQDHRRLHRGAR